MTTNQANSATSETQPALPEGELSALRCSQSEIEAFRVALPRASHLRDFASDCVCAYAQSRGLVGLVASSFSVTHGLGINLARALVPTLIHNLGESGIAVKGIMPFGVYLGVFPSPAFLRSVSQDRSILHHVNQMEVKHLEQLSPALMELSQAEVEQRWLNVLGAAFLCVSPGSSLSVSNFAKFLPEFDGKEKRVATLLDVLHEREVITLSNAAGSSEIFFSESLLEQIHDQALVGKLRDRRRKPEMFPFIVRDIPRFAGVAVPDRVGQSAALHSELGQRRGEQASQAVVTKPGVKGNAVDRPHSEQLSDGNKAGREVRERILRVFEEASTLRMGDLTKALADLELTDANVRYHVSLLCEKGFLTRAGKGRGAVISRGSAT